MLLQFCDMQIMTTLSVPAAGKFRRSYRLNVRLMFAVSPSSLLLVVTLVFATASPVAGVSELRTVALSGRQAPGLSDGVVFKFFDRSPSINDLGQTVFVGSLAGSSVGSDNDLGVWSESTGVLRLVTVEGEQAPGALAGTTFGRNRWQAYHQQRRHGSSLSLVDGGFR